MLGRFMRVWQSRQDLASVMCIQMSALYVAWDRHGLENIGRPPFHGLPLEEETGPGAGAAARGVCSVIILNSVFCIFIFVSSKA